MKTAMRLLPVLVVCALAAVVSCYDNSNDVARPDQASVDGRSIPPPLVVLDIDPHSCPNRLSLPHETTRKKKKAVAKKKKKRKLNPHRGGIIQAAILGSETLDVRHVDTASIALESAYAFAYKYMDVGSANGTSDCECERTRQDGREDLLLYFNKADATEDIDGRAGDTAWLTVSGNFLDGTVFEASDCVLIVPQGPPAKKKKK